MIPTVPAGPIRGNERVRIIQGGVAIWADKTQLAAILAAQSVGTPPNPKTVPIRGAETVLALQGGQRVFMSGAQLSTLLGMVSTAPDIPGNGVFGSATGSEVFVGIQDGIRAQFSIADTLALTGSLVPVPPVGFYANGSTNPKLKAMLARVRAGSGSGTLLYKGDSTKTGEGAGTAVNGVAVGGARIYRPGAVLATLLTNAGYPALDGSMVGDNGMAFSGAAIDVPSYDPRFAGIAVSATSSIWGVFANQSFAGGGILIPEPSSFTYTPDFPCDSFEVIAYNSGAATHNFLIDGAAPLSGPSLSTVNGTGLVRQIVRAAAVGTHTLSIATPSAAGNIRSVRAFRSDRATINIMSHASRGADSSQQAASNGNWFNLEAIATDAPDQTIINLGINDIARGISAASYTNNLNALVSAAKVTGDVLLEFTHPTNGATQSQLQTYNDAAKAVAASQGVAFLSLWEYYGAQYTTAFGTRLNDGTHPKAGLYAEIAGLEQQALAVMAA